MIDEEFVSYTTLDEELVKIILATNSTNNLLKKKDDLQKDLQKYQGDNYRVNLNALLVFVNVALFVEIITEGLNNTNGWISSFFIISSLWLYFEWSNYKNSKRLYAHYICAINRKQKDLCQ